MTFRQAVSPLRGGTRAVGMRLAVGVVVHDDTCDASADLAERHNAASGLAPKFASQCCIGMTSSRK
jgi:hypothetical protein